MNESLDNMKANHDLQMEKMKIDKYHDTTTHTNLVDKKDATINKLTGEINKLKVELEMIKDEKFWWRIYMKEMARIGGRLIQNILALQNITVFVPNSGFLY